MSAAATATIFSNVLYRIKKPVKKLAFVKRGANGNTWHLLKETPSAPDEDFIEHPKSLLAEDVKKVIDGLVESLTREEAEEVVS